MGWDAWFALARDYVEAHPSDHSNLNEFGRHLPAFMAARADLTHSEFLAELATLQWTVAESFKAPEFEPLDVESLRDLTQEQWASVAFQPNPTVRLMRFAYPVNGYLQAYFEDRKPTIPEPTENWLLVHRKDDRVWRVKLPAPIFAILSALVASEPFGSALEAGGEHEEDVGRWFQEWSADGLFVEVR